MVEYQWFLPYHKEKISSMFHRLGLGNWMCKNASYMLTMKGKPKFNVERMHISTGKHMKLSVPV